VVEAWEGCQRRKGGNPGSLLGRGGSGGPGCEGGVQRGEGLWGESVIGSAGSGRRVLGDVRIWQVCLVGGVCAGVWADGVYLAYDLKNES
jgi:hypothetical protein